MTTQTISFTQFWRSINAILNSREQPDMLYGEAKSFWSEISDTEIEEDHEPLGDEDQYDDTGETQNDYLATRLGHAQ